ncbi:MAG TPA: O-antigen ligase family protein, partial [Geminicoccaceae bacterium]
LIGTLLSPDSKTAQFSFTAVFYVLEDSFGDVATRLVLFFPWPTALAMGCIAIVLVSLREPSRAWRYVGVGGGLLGLVSSWSRIGFAAFAVAIAAELFLRLDRLARAGLVAAFFLVLLGLLVAGLDPFERLSDARQTVNAARSGSSMARELIYERSWEGFLESPLLGHGWIGGSVHRTEDLPIGSHSTVYGLLYTGGALTFGTFALALGATLAGTARVAFGPDPTLAGRTALGLALTLLVFCPYEMLFSFSLPCLFLFTWIGGALREVEDTLPTNPTDRTAPRCPTRSSAS